MLVLRSALAIVVSVLSVALLSSCGGQTSSDEGSSAAAGAAGTSGSAGSAGAAGVNGASGASGAAGIAAQAGSAGTGGAPQGCLLDAPSDGPYSVKLRLTNNSPTTIGLWQECGLDASFSSCESGFVDPLTVDAGCTQSCGSDPMGGCIYCGACPSQALALSPGEVLDLDWDGRTYSFDMAFGCQCSIAHDAPAAHYRLSVPIYPAVGPASPKPAPTRTVTHDFQLSVSSGVEEVLLAP